MNLKMLCTTALAAVFLLATGCSEDQFDLAPVSGVVKLGGQPLANGVVKFQPIAKEGEQLAGPGSTGITDAEGRYVLTTDDGEQGAVVGEHKVRIYSHNAEGPPPPSDTDPRPPVELVPRRYNYQTTLIHTVPAEGDTTADFDLPTE